MAGVMGPRASGPSCASPCCAARGEDALEAELPPRWRQPIGVPGWLLELERWELRRMWAVVGLGRVASLVVTADMLEAAWGAGMEGAVGGVRGVHVLALLEGESE